MKKILLAIVLIISIVCDTCAVYAENTEKVATPDDDIQIITWEMEEVKQKQTELANGSVTEEVPEPITFDTILEHKYEIILILIAVIVLFIIIIIVVSIRGKRRWRR